MSQINTKKLAVYYGWPSAVNSAGGDVNAAVNTFKNYQTVVFGDGLQETSHPDHANTVSIINHTDMSGTEVFGYIDSTLSLNTIQEKIDKWVVMGVAGIFFDKFGYDFGLTREKQREIVWCIHEKDGGYKAFVNAWNPDDVFSPAVNATYNPSGLATRLGSNDLYLAESFAIINGNYDDADGDSNGIKDFQDKAVKMTNYRTTYGTSMAAITTPDASGNFDQNKADYSYYSAVVNNFDLWGWSELFYSASSAALPMRTRKAITGTKFIGTITYNAGKIERNTNVGIHIDTNAHTVSEFTD
jgi:hypothetical protein